MIFKTEDEESWNFSIPDDVLSENTVIVPPGGNSLSGIFEVTSTDLFIPDLSDPELEPGMYYIDLLYTNLSGF